MSLERIKQIRDVFSYSKRFRKQTFIVYLDDSLFQEGKMSSLVSDIQRMREAQTNIVIVPDIQTTAQRVFFQSGRSSDFLHDDSIAVEQDDIELLQRAVFEVTGKLLALFALHKQVAVVGNWVGARSAGVIKNKDLLFSGALEKVDTYAVHTLFKDGVIPIVPALGWSHKTIPYYLPAVELSSQIAVHLGASKLLYLRDANRDQVLNELGLNADDSGLNYSENGIAIHMTTEKSLELLHELRGKSKSMSARMMTSTLHALEQGVDRAHILDGNIEGALLIEVYFDQGVGFMVYADEYSVIGPVQEEEIPLVHEIMLPHIKNGTLLFRDQENIRENLNDYVGYRIEGEICGVAALHPLDSSSAEIGGVAVHKRYDNFGVGKRLVQYLLHKAEKDNFVRVYGLTKTIGDWLEMIGFSQVKAETLPKTRYLQYQKLSRNSRVYMYSVTSSV